MRICNFYRYLLVILLFYTLNLNTMKPTAELIREHEKIKRILNVMSKVSEELKMKRIVYSEGVEMVPEFLLNYWDKCHCRKEEKVLYPALVLD